MTLHLKAPAKINWFLSVTGKRDDGYHDIVSIIQNVDLFDLLSIERADGITLESDLGIPITDNLVYRAALLLKEFSGYKRGARIRLTKQVPVTAGLGGGSSDAAFTLSGLNRLWELGLGNDVLSSLGARLGSDVPFFINGPVALVEGRGEKVSSLPVNSSFALLLVKPPIQVPASFAYSRVRPELTRKSIDIKLFSLALEGNDIAFLIKSVFNDLEPQVMAEYPVIAGIKDKLMDGGARLALMSGSGPTVFGLFDSIEDAQRASGLMGDFWCSAVRTLNL